MSGNEGGEESSIPFGFTVVQDDRQAQQQQGQDESHQPSGPPLLDNNETGLLRDFFDNPNNIDPGFLAAAQGRQPQQQQEYDPYATSPQQPWFLPPDQGAHSASASHQTSPVQPFGYQQSPTEDVYAAARLLQSGQGAYTNGSMGAGSYPGATHAPQAAMYAYEQHHQSGFGGPGLDEGQGPPTDPALYAGMTPQNRPMSESRRSAPLNFGSDSKFRGSKYAAPPSQKPQDQELMQIVSSLSHDTGASPTQTSQQMSPVQTAHSGRKRRRLSATEERTASSEGDVPSKRGKTRAKNEADSEDDLYEVSGTTQRRSSTKTRTPGSPGARRKSSPTSKKPARENLTEEQKRSNHIQSEQKRRNLIKMGFEDTNRMVPELRAGGFSKSNMLQEAAKFMRELKEGNNRMAAMLGMIDKG